MINKGFTPLENKRKKSLTGFTHLHLHSQYSLLDGAIVFDELLKRCKDKWQITSFAIFNVIYTRGRLLNKCLHQASPLPWGQPPRTRGEGRGLTDFSKYSIAWGISRARTISDCSANLLILPLPPPVRRL